MKQANINHDDYLKAVDEYNYRLNLPSSDPEKMKNFGCWLKHYQMLDVKPLAVAIENSFKSFYTHFEINPMSKKSLPSIAFAAAFKLFDQNMPYLTSFSHMFDETRQLFRSNQLGGLVNIYHRHVNIIDNEGPESTRIGPNGERYSYFSFWDFNSLYLWAQDQPLPLSPGLLWQKSSETSSRFTKRTMVQGVSRGQIEWLMWLQTEPICVDKDGIRQQIQHAYFQGEKDICEKPVDGYFTKDGEEYYLEYYGCQFHPGCCVPDHRIKNAEQKRMNDKAKQIEMKAKGHLIIMRECSWIEQKRRMINKPKTQLGRVLFEDTESSLLKAIQDEDVFGFIVADVKTPDELRESFGSFLFPPVVQRYDIKSSMLSNFMKQVCEEECTNVDAQLPTLIQTYNGKQILLLTTMAKLYLDRGMIVDNITQFVQYIPGQALHPFVSKVVSMRTEAKRSGDEAKSLTAKLFGNSSYGKMGESVERYRKTQLYTDDKAVVRAKRSALVKSSNELFTENGKQVGHELSKLKSRVDDTKPVHVAVAILQYAKLLFLR